MPWLGGKKSYDRTRILEAARRAARRGNHARASTEYARVHAAEPNNTDVLRKLASHRARAGQHDAAWRDYQRVAGVLKSRGFVDQAIGVYRDAVGHGLVGVAVWEALSALELERKRRPDAVSVLIEGSRHYRSRHLRGRALELLERARNLDCLHFAASFELAGILAKSHARPRARRILEELARTTRGRDLRRLRGRLFRLSPTPAAAWRWLAALAARKTRDASPRSAALATQPRDAASRPAGRTPAGSSR